MPSSFNAATAKVGSRWVCRDGRVLVFQSYKPSATISHQAQFEGESYRCPDGTWDVRGLSDPLDIIGPAVEPGAPEPETDHNGLPIPADESPDTPILVWEVSPHPGTNDFDMLWERSWQKMLDYVETNLPNFLERYDEEELIEGVTLTFRLIRKTPRTLQEDVEHE